MSRYFGDSSGGGMFGGSSGGGGGPNIVIGGGGHSMPWGAGNRLFPPHGRGTASPPPQPKPAAPVSATVQGIEQAKQKAAMVPLLASQAPPQNTQVAAVGVAPPGGQTHAPVSPAPSINRFLRQANAPENHEDNMVDQSMMAGMESQAGDLYESMRKIAAKFAAQDNSKPRQSAAGESDGLSFQDAGPQRFGRDGWDISKYQRKPGKTPDPFMGRHSSEKMGFNLGSFGGLFGSQQPTQATQPQQAGAGGFLSQLPYWGAAAGSGALALGGNKAVRDSIGQGRWGQVFRSGSRGVGGGWKGMLLRGLGGALAGGTAGSLFGQAAGTGAGKVNEGVGDPLNKPGVLGPSKTGSARITPEEMLDFFAAARVDGPVFARLEKEAAGLTDLLKSTWGAVKKPVMGMFKSKAAPMAFAQPAAQRAALETARMGRTVNPTAVGANRVSTIWDPSHGVDALRPNFPLPGVSTKPNMNFMRQAGEGQGLWRGITKNVQPMNSLMGALGGAQIGYDMTGDATGGWTGAALGALSMNKRLGSLARRVPGATGALGVPQRAIIGANIGGALDTLNPFGPSPEQIEAGAKPVNFSRWGAMLGAGSGAARAGMMTAQKVGPQGLAAAAQKGLNLEQRVVGKKGLGGFAQGVFDAPFATMRGIKNLAWNKPMAAMTGNASYLVKGTPKNFATAAGTVAGLGGMGLSGTGAAYGLANHAIDAKAQQLADKTLHETILPAADKRMAQYADAATQHAHNYLTSIGAVNPQTNQIDLSHAAGMHGMQGLVSKLDPVFRMMGMDPNAYTPQQKMMMLGGAATTAAGFATGNPLIGMAGMGAMGHGGFPRQQGQAGYEHVHRNELQHQMDLARQHAYRPQG